MALGRASVKTVAMVTGTTYGGFGPQQTYQYNGDRYGFKTDSATISDETVWYFYVKEPVSPPGASAGKDLPLLLAGAVSRSRPHCGRHLHGNSNRLEMMDDSDIPHSVSTRKQSC